MNENHPLQKVKNFIHLLQSQFAAIKYGNPASKLINIGITGTDGKTTVTTMVYHILKNSGIPAAMISTISAKIGDEDLDTGFHVTTPDPWDVPKYMQLMLNKGIKFAVLESTSSGLSQNRLAGIKFDSAIITNIRNDHLDYHGTWDNYAKAKFRLLEMMKDKGLAVLNRDDQRSAEWLNEQSGNLKQDVFVKWCSVNDLQNINYDINGIRFEYFDREFFIPIIGEHNFINTIQAINLCLRYTDIDSIKEALETYRTPNGRMELMLTEPFGVIVDFAHTPAALESALLSLVKLNKNKGRVITVFGCAGKRDKGRRLMGEVAAQYSDIVIITAEDPRNEKLKDINDEIINHAKNANGQLIYRFASSDEYQELNLNNMKNSIKEAIRSKQKPVIAFDEETVASRRDAINFAMKIAEKDDIIFITGKGHEKSLAFGEPEKEYSWSDQAVVKEIYKELFSK